VSLKPNLQRLLLWRTHAALPLEHRSACALTSCNEDRVMGDLVLRFHSYQRQSIKAFALCNCVRCRISNGTTLNGVRMLKVPSANRHMSAKRAWQAFRKIRHSSLHKTLCQRRMPAPKTSRMAYPGTLTTTPVALRAHIQRIPPPRYSLSSAPQSPTSGWHGAEIPTSTRPRGWVP